MGSAQTNKTGAWKRHPKLTIVGDCRTHLVLAVLTGRGPSPDTDQMKTTLRTLPQSVRLSLLLGDAGYDSEENHQYVNQKLGVKTLIPPWA